MGGQSIPLVAARGRVRRLIYLCALLSIPGQPLIRQLTDDASMVNPDYAKGLSDTDIEGRRMWVDMVIARAHLFADCDAESALVALARLRPQALHPYRLPCSLSELPDVDSTYVLCTEDMMVNAEWSRRVAPERIGADVIEMLGGDSLFLTRPRALADVLHRLA
jgi:Alpha/beta hydrolase family